VIAYQMGYKGTLYLTDRRLIFEWSEGLVSKQSHQAAVALSDVQSVGVNHPRLSAGEIIVRASNTSNGFRSSLIAFKIAMSPEVWAGKIDNLLTRPTSQAPQPVVVQREVIQREIVKIPCRYCGVLVDAFRADKCPNCGAPLHLG